VSHSYFSVNRFKFASSDHLLARKATRINELSAGMNEISVKPAITVDVIRRDRN
jgi:hypothetical protein